MAHHHGKYYERPDGYVYSTEELDAYRIPGPQRTRCVNFFVPYFRCQQIKTENLLKAALAGLDQGLDNWGGDCHREKQEYMNCANLEYQYSLAIPTRNVYTSNLWQATQQSVSAEFEKNHYNSPVLY